MFAVSLLCNEYRQEADYCMARADVATSDETRADWLRLAAKSLAMLPARDGNQQTFDCALRDKGTHQEDSNSSH